MARRNPYFWADAESYRINAGELPHGARARLEELRGSRRFTSFLSPRALAAAADARIEPLGQVVGFSSGEKLLGVVRTTRPGQRRARLGEPRWRELSGPVRAWATVRRHARWRLAEQAKLLGADAVVGVRASRREHGAFGGFGTGGEPSGEALEVVELELLGTAVRMPGLRRGRDAGPLLTLASAQELWALMRAGVEPVGIVGGYANVETRPSATTALVAVGTANAELPDPTIAIYEARQLAMRRLVADARGIGAGGVLGVDLHDRHERGSGRVPALRVEVHVLGSAVRRVRPAPVEPRPVVRVGGAGHG